MDNSALIGKIVNWPNIGDPEEEGFIVCGRGKVVETLDSPFILIKRVSRGGDPEPSYMFVLPMNIPNMHFFDTLRQEQNWWNWVFSESAPVVKLVDIGK